MNVKDLKCPVCGGTFEEGFILDFGYWKQQYVQRWVEGSPQNTPLLQVPAFSDRRNYWIEANRCTNCGNLSLFAKDLIR